MTLFHVVIHALRARSRSLVADLPGALAGSFGCAEDQVRIWVVEVDHTDQGPLAVVYGDALAPGDARPGAVAAAVAEIQGDEAAHVSVSWVVRG